MPQGAVRRAYLPVGIETLRRLHRTGHLGPGVEGCAETDRLRAQLGDIGDEELEYALATAAGEVVPPDEGTPASGRRIVLVVDVDDEHVHEDPQSPGWVTLTAAVALHQVTAVLADSSDAGLGRGPADEPLGWFATQEIVDLLA